MQRLLLFSAIFVWALVLPVFIAGCAGGGCGGDDDTDDDTEPTVPEAPSNLTAAGAGEEITLSWWDNSDDEDGFNIYFRDHGAGDFVLLEAVGADTTSFVHEAGRDRHYDYVVTAYNDAGESDYSNVVDAFTAPNPPTNLHISAAYRDSLGEVALHFRWDDNSGVENSYVIERQGYWSSDWEIVAELPFDTTEYDIGGASCDVAYSRFRVKARNDAGEGASGAEETGIEDEAGCWRVYTVDSEGRVGAPTSIALDRGGFVRISYCDCANGDLKYAANRPPER